MFRAAHSPSQVAQRLEKKTLRCSARNLQLSSLCFRPKRSTRPPASSRWAQGLAGRYLPTNMIPPLPRCDCLVQKNCAPPAPLRAPMPVRNSLHSGEIRFRFWAPKMGSEMGAFNKKVNRRFPFWGPNLVPKMGTENRPKSAPISSLKGR